MWQKLKNLFDRRRLFVIAALLIIGYAGFSTLNIISRNYKLQKQVDKLNSEIELLKLQNQELEYRIAYYRTDAFIEKEARDKLSLQAPGEHVVIFPNKIPTTAEPQLNAQQQAATEPFIQRSQTNLQHWLYFLFRIEPKN